MKVLKAVSVLRSERQWVLLPLGQWRDFLLPLNLQGASLALPLDLREREEVTRPFRGTSLMRISPPPLPLGPP